MRKGRFAAIGAIFLGTAGPAAAQGIPVYDSSGYRRDRISPGVTAFSSRRSG